MEVVISRTKNIKTMNHCQLKEKNKIAIPPLEIRKHRNTIGIPSPKISSEIVRVFKKNKRSNKDLDLCTTISFSISRQNNVSIINVNKHIETKLFVCRYSIQFIF